jgi:hypothetical protein
MSDCRPSRDHAKPGVQGSEFAQKRLEGRISQPSFLGTGRILERLQTVQNQAGLAMRNELCQSFALLPLRSEPWIWIAKRFRTAMPFPPLFRAGSHYRDKPACRAR